MSNNDNQRKPSNLPEGLSSIADDEAIMEIDLGEFLEESANGSPLFEGFSEDIENTHQSITDDWESLYADIMKSGPETIVPRPMSELTEPEAEPEIFAEPENTALESLWMNPEEYFESDIPVVSLEDSAENEVQNLIKGDIPSDVFFEPSAVDELAATKSEDKARSDIFNMIDLMKAETDSETGFDDILSEIEANTGIAPVATELSVASQLVSETPPPAIEEPEEEIYIEEEYEEIEFGDEEISWDALEYDDAPAETLPAAEEVVAEEEVAAEELAADEFAAENFVDEEILTEDVATIAPEVPAEEAESAFDKELVMLLGEEKTEEEPAEFIISIPDDNVDYEKAAQPSEKLYEAAPMSAQALKEDPDLTGYTKDGQAVSGKKEKNSKQSGGKKKGGAGDVIRKIVLSLSIVTIIVSCAILVNTYFIEPYRFKSDSEVLVEQMSVGSDEHDQSATVNDQIKSENPDTEFPEGMLAKYAQLYAQNNDFSGWITIEGLGINLPIAKGKDNSYYLKRDIYKKYTSYGVPFFDYRISDLKNLHKNTMVYGHNMRHDDYIFGMLENYRTIEGFAQAPVIECNTIYGDHTWFVYAVFITNSKPKDDNGYFLPYNFVDVSTDKFVDYIEEIDKRKLYTTGVDINENDKILTLQACVYEFDGAMIVVVAREKRPGESKNVDTSKATYNPNPKYPQKWYDINKKTNPYAEDTRW